MVGNMNLHSIRIEYKKRKHEIKSRLEDFKNQKNYFYELCYCILTPQSKQNRCDECIRVLKKIDFANSDIRLKSILSKYTRFHNRKADYLIKIKCDREKIMHELSKLNDAEEKREYLVKNVKGLGMKEASHFLRNIGFSNLAILDRHILKQMKELDIIHKIPGSPTKRQYLDIEEKFRRFAKKIQIPLDELDLLFWSMKTGRVSK